MARLIFGWLAALSWLEAGAGATLLHGGGQMVMVRPWGESGDMVDHGS